MWVYSMITQSFVIKATLTVLTSSLGDCDENASHDLNQSAILCSQSHYLKIYIIT